MSKAIRSQNLNAAVVMALIDVLLLLAALVFTLLPAPTIGDANPLIHARSAGGTGESSLTEDPNIERHAEVVQRLGNGSLR